MRSHRVALIFFFISIIYVITHPPFLHGGNDDKGPKGTIRVGIFPFAPFNFVDEQGMAQGLNVDLLREISKNEDWLIRFVPGSWAEGLQRLQNQEIDLMLSVAYSDERNKILDFTYESVAELWGQVFVRPDNHSQNISDLAGKRVGVMSKDISGSNFMQTAAQMNIQCTIVEYASHGDVFRAVEQKEIDAGVAPQHFGLRHADEYNIIASTIMFSPFSIYMASKKGSQHELLSHIDAQIARWKMDKDSFFYQRQNYWLSNNKSVWKLPNWIVLLIVVSGGAIFICASFIVVLNRAVSRKTQELQNSLAWHRVVLQAAMDGFLIVDKLGWIQEVNQAYCQMSGYSEEELLVMNIDALECADSIDNAQPSYEKILDHRNNRFETIHQTKDGSRIILATHVQPSPTDGSRIIVFLQDITDRKKLSALKEFLAQSYRTDSAHPYFYQLAEYLAQFLEMDFVCIDRLDTNGLTAHTVALWNNGHFEDNTSYALHDTPCGALVSQKTCCYPADVCQSFPNDTLLQELKAESYVGATLFDPTGIPIGLIAVIGTSPLRSAKLAEDALQLVAVRASGEMKSLLMEEEKKSLEAQLLQSRKMEAIGTLAGGIAHDFNNILGAIIGFAEMAQEEVAEGSRVRRDLDKVLEASHRAAALVKQILAFSRRADAERIALAPIHLVKEVIKFLRPTLPSTIVIRQDYDVPTKSILANPTEFHQVVMNLCTNAFHAMEHTGGTLDITLKHCHFSASELQQYPSVRPGDFVRLSIKDSGCGIAPEIQSRIFDPYFTTKEIGKGTGMGLAIVHGIVTHAGGFITCESELGCGTTFSLFLPTIEQPETSLQPPATPLPSGQGHLLLVDDEVILADINTAMLQSLGYTVTAFNNSLEALQEFTRNPNRYDAVITDQTMPGLTGMGLAEQILQIRPTLPIILCTGYSNLTNEQLAKEIGIQGFLMKPITKNTIATLLKSLLRERS